MTPFFPLSIQVFPGPWPNLHCLYRGHTEDAGFSSVVRSVFLYAVVAWAWQYVRYSRRRFKLSTRSEGDPITEGASHRSVSQASSCPRTNMELRV